MAQNPNLDQAPQNPTAQKQRNAGNPNVNTPDEDLEDDVENKLAGGDDADLGDSDENELANADAKNQVEDCAPGNKNKTQGQGQSYSATSTKTTH